MCKPLAHGCGLALSLPLSLARARLPRLAAADFSPQNLERDAFLQDELRKSAEGWVDLGANLIRASHLRAHPVANNFTDCGPWREADGRRIQRLVQLTESRVVLDRVLFVHQ